MPRTAKFTDAWLRALPLCEAGQEVIWDETAPGFGLKVGTKTKAFIVRYSIAGRRREMTLGTWPEVKLKDARDRARDIRGGARSGEDALAERRKRESELSRDASFGAMIRLYWEKDAKHRALRQRVQEERLILNHVMPEWEDTPVSDITSADALDLLEGIAERAPVQANRVLFALRRPFRFAVMKRLILTSPVADIERLTPENRRDRVLTDAELKAIWTTAGEMGVFGALVRALIVTGSRRDEVRDATWPEFDRAALVWVRPADRMKGKQAHALPITPKLEDVLSELSEGPGFVFSTDADGATRYGALSRAKAKLDKLAGVTGWTLHDIRRTVRTRLAEIGVPFEIAEKVLAHRTDKIEAVYNLHQYTEEKRDALLRWEARLSTIIGETGATVVPLRRA